VPAESTDLNGKKAIGEWHFSDNLMLVKDYEPFAAHFNPVRLDAHQWANTAKETT
jgi:alpha-L-fucosidase